jgi:hypothetical protein
MQGARLGLSRVRRQQRNLCSLSVHRQAAAALDGCPAVEQQVQSVCLALQQEHGGCDPPHIISRNEKRSFFQVVHRPGGRQCGP